MQAMKSRLGNALERHSLGQGKLLCLAGALSQRQQVRYNVSETDE